MNRTSSLPWVKKDSTLVKKNYSVVIKVLPSGKFIPHHAKLNKDVGAEMCIRYAKAIANNYYKKERTI